MTGATLNQPDFALAPYQGERPPAPGWFHKALANAPERTFYEHAGRKTELLTWGEQGRPGLLFLHGNSAHADWWSFIAPYFASEWRCAAISWAGMGRSDWREEGYSMESYADQAIAAFDAAGLDNGDGVMIVAHSYGGYPALVAGAKSDRIRGIISLDSAILSPERLASLAFQLPLIRPHRINSSEADALGRFRFMPSTVGDNHYIIDHVARHGLKQVVDADGKAGWSWGFDPVIWKNGEPEQHPALPRATRCPLALLVGENSEMLNEEVSTYMRGLYPEGTPFITIPDAGHHIMIDQPLALVAALRSCLEYWPRRA